MTVKNLNAKDLQKDKFDQKLDQKGETLEISTEDCP
tara:strand:- start:1125 stop:1232 length:108 start_codon:yes stop_codon:yes gene_type:complete